VSTIGSGSIRRNGFDPSDFAPINREKLLNLIPLAKLGAGELEGDSLLICKSNELSSM